MHNIQMFDFLYCKKRPGTLVVESEKKNNNRLKVDLLAFNYILLSSSYGVCIVVMDPNVKWFIWQHFPHLTLSSTSTYQFSTSHTCSLIAGSSMNQLVDWQKNLKYFMVSESQMWGFAVVWGFKWC